MNNIVHVKKYCKLVGYNFTAKYIYDVMEKIKYLKVNEYKKQYILELLKKEESVKTYTSMEVKINNLIKIIEFGYAVDALQYIINSKRINNSNPEVVSIAKETLNKITKI